MKKLTVNSVICNHTTSGPGTDDVFFMHQSDGGAPLRYPSTSVYEMNKGDSQVLTPAGGPGMIIYYEYGCFISAWDHDGPLNQLNPSDIIGNIGLQADAGSGNYTLQDNDSADYTLNITVEDAS